MPRTVEDIIEHADELARRFEEYEPQAENERATEVLHQLRHAVTARSDAERLIWDAVEHARRAGLSWVLIGSLLGTSGEAARQRYGHLPKSKRHRGAA